MSAYGNDRVLFNFCSGFIPAANENCEKTGRYGYIVSDSSSLSPEKTCSPITASYYESSTVLFNEIENGITLSFSSSEIACPASFLVKGTYGLKITAYCDRTLKSGEQRDIKWNRNTPGTCIQEVSLYSKDACPAFDANALWTFFETYWFIFGVLYIFIGAFVTFFGRILIKPTVFFVSFITITFV